MCHRICIFNGYAVLFAAVFLLGVTRAGAQTEPKPEDVVRSLVFTERAAYQRGARMLLSADETTIVPDPRGRYALIGCGDDAPPDPFTGESAPGVARLLLYDSVTGRVKTVWQQDAADQSEWTGDVDPVKWLPQTDTALAIVSDRYEPRDKAAHPHPKSDVSLLLIRASLGSSGVRRLLQGENPMWLYASPRSPFAIVDEVQDLPAPDGKAEHYDFSTRWFTVNEQGTFGPMFPLGPHSRGGFQWDDAGTTTYFTDRVPIDAVPTANGDASPTEKPRTRTQWYAFNVQTQAMAPIDKRPKDVEKPDPPADGPLRLVQNALSSVPPNSAGAQPPVPPDAIAPLYLVRADNKREGGLPNETLIASDAQKSYLLADNSAVLYVADGAVYAVPLTRQPRPNFDAQYQKFLQDATVSRAKQIALALVGCAQDYDNMFPQSDNYATLIVPYVRSNDVFDNPVTGQSGFTYLLNGDNIAAITATTAIGYLSGPGGRAVLYGDGHAAWENAPTPPSSPPSSP